MPFNLSKEDATLIAAAIAALIALTNTILNVINTQNLPIKEAFRKILIEDMNNLGSALYYAVAISKKMLDSRNDNSFQNFRKMSETHRGELGVLRAKLRYSLWGLDNAIMAVQSVPFFIWHFKNDRKNKRASKIVDLGTRLRIEIDKAVISSYLSGKPPSLYRKTRANYRAWRLRKCFQNK